MSDNDVHPCLCFAWRHAIFWSSYCSKPCFWEETILSLFISKEKKRKNKMFFLCPLSSSRQNRPGKPVGWKHRILFQPRGSFGTNVSLKHRVSVLQHFQNGPGWKFIDIIHNKNKTSDLLVFVCLHGCLALFWHRAHQVLLLVNIFYALF